MAGKLNAAQLAALEQFKNGKLDNAALLEVLKSDQQTFTAEGIEWQGKPIVRFNHNPNKPAGPFNGKSIGARLVKQIVDNLDAVQAAIKQAEELTAKK